MKKLTQKQENFALAYVECGNASEAYRRAYNTSKMKSETINRMAYELLKDHKITTMVEELQKEAQKRTGVTVDRLVNELSKSAFFDFRKLYDEDGELKKVNDLDDDTASAIQEITSNIVADGMVEVVKYKMADKLKALDILMKHLGGYKIDNNQKITQIEIIRKSVR